MTEKRIAIPTNAPGGEDSTVSAHFGHCDGFTVLTLEDDAIVKADLIHLPDHGHGGCMLPVRALVDAGAEAVVVGGIGQRPLQGFQHFGLPVYFASGLETVREVVAAFVSGKLVELEPGQVCGGGHAH